MFAAMAAFWAAVLVPVHCLSKGSRSRKAAALAAYARGDLDKAFKIFMQISEDDPSDAESLYYLGVILHESGNDEEAARRLEQALENEPGMEAASSLLSELYRSGVTPGGRAALLLSARLNAGYDTKPVVEPWEALLGVSEACGVSKIDLEVSTSLGQWGRGKLMFFTRAAAAAYWGREPDLTNAALSAGGMYQLTVSTISASPVFKLGYTASVGFLLGGDGMHEVVLEPGRGLYLEDHAFTMGLFSNVEKRLPTAVWADYRLRRYSGLLWPHGFKGHDVCARKGFEMQDWNADVAFTGCLRWELANLDTWSRVAPRGWLDLSLRPGAGIEVKLQAGYEHDMHPWGEGEWVGNQLTSAAEVVFALFGTWRLHMTWRHREYGEDQVGLGHRRDMVLFGIEAIPGR